MSTFTIEEWIEALESGKYSQTRAYLKDNRGYCCLGVACELIDPDGWTLGTTFEEVYSGYDEDEEPEYVTVEADYYQASDGSTEMPSYETLRRMGITEDEAEALASANDSGKSFAHIANMLRFRQEHGRLPYYEEM